MAPAADEDEAPRATRPEALNSHPAGLCFCLLGVALFGGLFGGERRAQMAMETIGENDPRVKPRPQAKTFLEFYRVAGLRILAARLQGARIYPGPLLLFPK